MPESGKDHQIELYVQGMTGAGGEPKVVRALEELPGVKEAHAHFPGKKAVVVYDRTLVSTEHMCQALLKVGYVATPKGNEAATRAMTQQGSGHKKEHQTKDLICYCFAFTKQDIERDLVENGRSMIMEKIMREKKIGGCDCKNLSPKGGGCLPDVRRVVEEATAGQRL